MAKVGRFVTDPKAGSYCQITLDSREKILVSHDKGGFAGGSVTIQEVRWWGFASAETLLRCDLESSEGRRILSRLVQGAPSGSARATPLGAFVDYVKDARSLGEVKTKCDALASMEPHSAA
jgi:hypothetical protein